MEDEDSVRAKEIHIIEKGQEMSRNGKAKGFHLFDIIVILKRVLVFIKEKYDLINN